MHVREEPGSLAYPPEDEDDNFGEFGAGNPGLSYHFDFGDERIRHKTLEEILVTNKKYVMWAIHPNRSRNRWYRRLVRAFKAYRKWERESGMDLGNRLWWFGKYHIQGKTFRWVYENDYQYIEWLLDEDKTDRHWYNEILRWKRDYESRPQRRQRQQQPLYTFDDNDCCAWDGEWTTHFADLEAAKSTRAGPSQNEYRDPSTLLQQWAPLSSPSPSPSSRGQQRKASSSTPQWNDEWETHFADLRTPDDSEDEGRRGPAQYECDDPFLVRRGSSKSSPPPRFEFPAPSAGTRIANLSTRRRNVEDEDEDDVHRLDTLPPLPVDSQSTTRNSTSIHEATPLRSHTSTFPGLLTPPQTLESSRSSRKRRRTTTAAAVLTPSTQMTHLEDEPVSHGTRSHTRIGALASSQSKSATILTWASSKRQREEVEVEAMIMGEDPSSTPQPSQKKRVRIEKNSTIAHGREYVAGILTPPSSQPRSIQRTHRPSPRKRLSLSSQQSVSGTKAMMLATPPSTMRKSRQRSLVWGDWRTTGVRASKYNTFPDRH